MIITREEFFSYCEENRAAKSAIKYFDALKTCNEFINFMDTNNEVIIIHNFSELERFLHFNDKKHYNNYGKEKYSFSKLAKSYNKREIRYIYNELGNECPIIKNKILSKYSNSTINAAISKIAGLINSNYKDYLQVTIGKKTEKLKTVPQNRPVETKEVYVKIVKRDPYIVEEALTLSNYQCEYNSSYTGFISNATEQVYLEVHHLIPLKFYTEFPNLDVIENLVVLSPEIHRLLHYGTNDDVKKVLRKLYEVKVEKLKHVNLYIEFDELFKLYFKQPKQKVLFVTEDLYKDLT